MADNYLEYARDNYEQRKAQWLSKQKKKTKVTRTIQRPEDEAL